ncbi:MAG TPA: NADH-quinone oxidoreductase subunit J [Gemmatimonadales bacterium]|nr:NADH-quinone oxidoreductase subunit J [Gemmatimonadales bacterium]
MTFLEFNFWAFAILSIVAATLCVTRRNAVASALWLVVTLFSLAALFVMLDAQFIAVLQVLVYAGAIMVLFLFVIMLLNVGRSGPGDLKGLFGAAVAVTLATGLLFLLARVTDATPPDAIRLPPGTTAAAQAQQGLIAVVAQPLFETYLIPFEITSLLLLAAAVGAVVLAKRRL